MLGHKMLQVLGDRFSDVRGTVRGRADQLLPGAITERWGKQILEGVDTTRLEELDQLLLSLRPRVIVNCVGTIKQRAEARDAIASITINSLLPHRLAAIAEQWGGRVVHFSTDCVFSGAKGSYTESDPSDALDLYGRSKFLGEISGPNSVTIRTSIIGRELSHHTSLLDWFLAQKGKTIRGFSRSCWSGVTTLHLSHVVAQLIEGHPGLSGLFQLSSGRISKYELLLMLKEAYAMRVTIEKDDSFVCDRSLSGDLFSATTGYSFPGWPVLLRDLVTDPTIYDGTN